MKHRRNLNEVREMNDKSKNDYKKKIKERMKGKPRKEGQEILGDFQESINHFVEQVCESEGVAKPQVFVIPTNYWGEVNLPRDLNGAYSNPTTKYSELEEENRGAIYLQQMVGRDIPKRFLSPSLPLVLHELGHHIAYKEGKSATNEEIAGEIRGELLDKYTSMWERKVPKPLGEK